MGALRGSGDRGGAGVRPAGWVLAVVGLAALVLVSWFAAGLIGDSPLEAAVRQLGAADPKARLAGIEQLERLDDPRGEDPVFDRLEKDESVDVRVAAAGALGARIAPGRAGRVVEVLSEDDPRLVIAALDALNQIQARTPPSDRQRREWSSALGRLLRFENGIVRRRAADLLIAMGPGATTSVRGQLSRQGETRALAIEILGKVGDEHAIGGLIYQFEEPGAVEAVRAVTERVGVGMLIRESHSRSAPAWHRIEGPITRLVLDMGDGVLDQLKGAACDMRMRAEGRRFARKLVRAIGGQEALEATVHCIVPMLGADHFRDRDIGRYELGRIGKPAVGPLIEAMQGMDDKAREQAGHVLRGLTRKRFGSDANGWLVWWKQVQGTGAWR